MFLPLGERWTLFPKEQEQSRSGNFARNGAFKLLVLWICDAGWGDGSLERMVYYADPLQLWIRTLVIPLRRISTLLGPSRICVSACHVI
jgi:hypothetical protein